MKEPTDLELIDHILGRGSPELRRELDDALAASAQLRRRRNELAALWRLLGEVDAEVPHRDLWPTLSERLADQTRRPGGQGLSVSATWWAAAAAAVVAAALVGYGSARLRLDRQTEVAAVAESDVIAQLKLTAFDNGPVRQLGRDLIENQTQGST